MGRHATDAGAGTFQQAPAGNHIARCIRLIDLGTQRNEYQGKVSIRNQVLVTWELCDEMMETDDGPKPFLVSKFYTNSLNEKATLRADLESWRGMAFTDEELKGFDLQKILGAACMVSVVHNDKGKAKISGVAKMPKNVKAPEARNPLVAFWLDEFNPAVFDTLSDGIREIIKRSPEYQALSNPRSNATAALTEMEDDIPWREDTSDVPF
jgi:hypothetical protein